MLESLDTMISLGVIFLVLSMVQKYVMSMVKRFLKIKPDIVAKEMKVFIGENTSRFLKLYVEKRAKHLNLLNKTKSFSNKTGFRMLDKEELKNITGELKDYLDRKTDEQIETELLGENPPLKDNIIIVKKHLSDLQIKAETIFGNTLRKIDDEYKQKIRIWTFVSAFILAIIMNASFFDIYKSISVDSTLRTQLVSGHTEITNEMKNLEKYISRLEQDDIEDIQKELSQAKEKMASITNLIPDGKQLFGWENGEFTRFIYFDEDTNIVFNKWIGFLISALLMSFGAPFWHDYLNGIIDVRKAIVKTRGKTVADASP